MADGKGVDDGLRDIDDEAIAAAVIAEIVEGESEGEVQDISAMIMAEISQGGIEDPDDDDVLDIMDEMLAILERLRGKVDAAIAKIESEGDTGK